MKLSDMDIKGELAGEDCPFCGVPLAEHKDFQENLLPTEPKPPELIDVEGEEWVLCFGLPILYMFYGVPLADSDPEKTSKLVRNTLSKSEFEELYE